MKYKIHRCNCRKVWTVQSRKTTVTASSILLNGAWRAELKPNRSCNPKGFVVTHSKEQIILEPARELVEQFLKTAKLMYDKEQITFSVDNGENLYFAEDGACYMLQRLQM